MYESFYSLSVTVFFVAMAFGRRGCRRTPPRLLLLLFLLLLLLLFNVFLLKRERFKL